MIVEVADNPGASRYEVRADGEVAGFAQYRLHDGRIVFLHTEIDPKYEGEGLGSRLARDALDDVRASGKEVVPMCPFITSYIRRHQEYLDLVVEPLRDAVTAAADPPPPA